MTEENYSNLFHVAGAVKYENIFMNIQRNMTYHTAQAVSLYCKIALT